MPLLPLKTQVNETTGLWAPASSGGGGGGGVGPTPSFSTITFPAAVPTPSGPTAGGILFSQQLIVDDPATDIAGDFAFTAAAPYSGVAGPTSTTSFTIFAPQNGCTLALGCGEDEVIYIDGAAGGGAPAMYVRGIGGISVSSMTISSINGQVPGGGGGGSSGGISVSSIKTFPGQTSPGPSTILMAPGPGGNFALTGYPLTNNVNGDIVLDTAISANALATAFQPGGNANAALILSPGGIGTQLNMGATDAGGAVIAAVNQSGAGSTLTVVSDATKFLQPVALGTSLDIVAADANLYSLNVSTVASLSLGTIGGRNQFYTTRGEVDDCMVSSLTAVAGANVQVLKPLAVSSIVGVSTINGAVYPPAGSGPTRTQVPTLAGISVPGTGAAVVVSADFSPTNGHLYTLTGQVYGQVSPNVAAGSQIMFQIGNNGSVYQAPFPANGLITPFGTNILDVNMTWRHSTSGAERLYCYFWDPTNGANASTFTNAVANMDLIDYGPVA